MCFYVWYIKHFKKQGNNTILTSVLNSRRSVRSYTGEAVPEETLKKIVNAANASAAGLAKYEAFRLTVVKNKDPLREPRDNTSRFFYVNHSFLYGAPELMLVSTAAPTMLGIPTPQSPLIIWLSRQWARESALPHSGLHYSSCRK